MEDFLRQNYSILTKSVEILAAVVGLFCLKKYRLTAVRYFIYFLIFVACIEIVGGYTNYVKNFGIEEVLSGTLFEKNYWWYTICWTFGSAVFYQFFYRKVLHTPNNKRILKWIGFSFVAVFVGYYMIDFKSLFLPTAFFIKVYGLFVIVSSIFFYFLEILQSDKILYFQRSAYFYISGIVLIWFFVTTPLMFFEHYSSNADWNYVILKWQIKLAANFFMYLSFTFTLLWCKPENM